MAWSTEYLPPPKSISTTYIPRKSSGSDSVAKSSKRWYRDATSILNANTIAAARVNGPSTRADEHTTCANIVSTSDGTMPMPIGSSKKFSEYC